jgi:conjugative transfer signal peptidase TraF
VYLKPYLPSSHVASRLRRVARGLAAGWFVVVSIGCLGQWLGLACNRTESLPIGYYRTRPLGPQLERGELVAVDPPPAFRQMVREREYLRPGERFFKKLLALPGDTVCLDGHQFRVNDRVIGPVLLEDRNGRALPQLSFCGRVAAGTYWVGTDHVRSFDSRYFGPVRRSEFRMGLEPLWTF